MFDKGIDPRIKLILLPTIGFLGFFLKETFLLLPLIIFAWGLFLASSMGIKGFGYLLFFSVLLFIEEVTSKTGAAGFAFAVYMVLYFVSRMTLIAMFANYITKTTSVSEMLEALNKLRIPRSISIPFSVLLRFAPTMRHEIKALHENMRVRGVIRGRRDALFHPVKCEYTLVPLLMRAVKISDELSASALIRGLDSERKRVTVINLKFKMADTLVVVLGIAISISIIMLQNKI